MAAAPPSRSRSWESPAIRSSASTRDECFTGAARAAICQKPHKSTFSGPGELLGCKIRLLSYKHLKDTSMSVKKLTTAVAAALLLAAPAFAQTPTGTISGHVADATGLALPGVTIAAASPNLQG